MSAAVDPIHHTITTIFGDTISATITGAANHTPHAWTADATTGLFHTTTNLAAEWKQDYQDALAGKAQTVIQHLEANAEAVFENTGLSKLAPATLARDREDVQRQFDAMAAALAINGDANQTAFTEHSYLAMEQTMQNNATLEELGMQGHGLNNSGQVRYAGYTNDFQNGVDGKTLFIGGGILNNNQNALTDFFDDNVLSHAPFAVVEKNGKLEQLNQNGAVENTMNESIVALNDSAYNRVYTAADFSTSHSTAATDAITHAPHYTAADQTALKALENAENAPAPAGDIKTLFGDIIANTLTLYDPTTGEGHNWVADANGLFHTANLAQEWHAAYVDLVTTGGHDLTTEQRWEANAEAAFENTALKNLSAADQQRDREDVQREFDASIAAMKLAGINDKATLTDALYLKLEHTLQGSAALEELAIQGHGLNNSGNPRYNGYTNDFQHNVDKTTVFVGGGLDSNQNALTDFFDDVIMSHVPFPTVVINGKLIQLNQNAAQEDLLHTAATALDKTLHISAFNAADFKPKTA